MRDPGLDRHQFETEWEGLEPLVEDSPAEALPEVGDLVERMLREMHIPIDDEVADDGIEPELVRDYASARETTNRVERGENVPPGDVGDAVHAFRRIYDALIGRLNA
jgi:hypothetical protein